jgi:hypothetical protein
MSITVAGFVKNGVVVPNAALPEGAFVEVHVIHGPIEVPPELQAELDAWQRAGAESLELVERLAGEREVQIRRQSAQPEAGPATPARFTPGELRRMPREQRQDILAAAAEMAEGDYRSDKELTGFETCGEEKPDDDESDSR